MNRQIIILATLTLVGFPFVGWILLWLLDGPAFYTLLVPSDRLWLELPIGAALGLVSGWTAWLLVKSPLMDPVRDKYGNLIQQFDLSPLQMVYVSLCAGIGEEILFRGVIQPYLGIWITAIFFVAIHGYLNPFNRRLFLYGAFMTLVIAAIGYLAQEMGLYGAMLAHALIDLILLWKLTRQGQTETQGEESSFMEGSDLHQ